MFPYYGERAGESVCSIRKWERWIEDGEKKKWKNEGARSSLQMNVEGLLPPPPRKQCYRVGGGDAC